MLYLKVVLVFLWLISYFLWIDLCGFRFFSFYSFFIVIVCVSFFFNRHRRSFFLDLVICSFLTSAFGIHIYIFIKSGDFFFWAGRVVKYKASMGVVLYGFYSYGFVLTAGLCMILYLWSAKMNPQANQSH